MEGLKAIGTISIDLSINSNLKPNTCQETWKDPNKIK